MTEEAGTEIVEEDHQAERGQEQEEAPLCQVCERDLNREVSTAAKVWDNVFDAFFAFFERLFSARGRAFRRVVYGCVGAYFGYRFLTDVWHGNGRIFSVHFASPRPWLREGDHRWYATAAVAAVVLLVIYRLRRRQQIKRGIKSPPWILIGFVALVAVSFSLAGGLLLYKFAPDQSAKFDAVKTALTMFAGAAGVGALVLSLRTHFTGETDRLNMQFDAAAQKLTDKSAVVQSAGLLALQRIGRRHAAYRHAVNQVIYAYLKHGDAAEASPGYDTQAETPTPQRADLAHRIWGEWE